LGYFLNRDVPDSWGCGSEAIVSQYNNADLDDAIPPRRSNVIAMAVNNVFVSSSNRRLALYRDGYSTLATVTRQQSSYGEVLGSPSRSSFIYTVFLIGDFLSLRIRGFSNGKIFIIRISV
jgi:hypothetical protein